MHYFLGIAMWMVATLSEGQGRIPLTTTPQPPPYYEYALMARYIMHRTDWVSMATISTLKDIEGYPFVGLKSLSDGPESNSTGIPYIYISNMDVSAKDLQKNSKVTIMATLAETDYCKGRSLDPEDPQCAKVIITGKFVKVDKNSEEYKFGQEALFERHPAMKTWPVGHEFYVSKVVPKQIIVLDFYGGIHLVTPQEYFNANITTAVNLDAYSRKVSVIEVANDNIYIQ